MMWRVTSRSGQDFTMTIEQVIQLSRRPGFYLAGKISSGVVRIGDHLNLLDGETVVRQVTAAMVSSSWKWTVTAPNWCS